MISLNLMRAGVVMLAAFCTISSVIGLSMVFKGASWAVAFAAGGLELGRYGLVSYAYIKWKTFSLPLQALVSVVIVATSLFTSIGVYGFLDSSFQSAHMKTAKTTGESDRLSAEKNRLESRLVEINQQVAGLPSDFVGGRLRLMQAFDKERADIQAELKTLRPQLETAVAESASDLGGLGSIVSISKKFGTTIENAIANVTIVISICLDMFVLFLTVVISRDSLLRLEKADESRQSDGISVAIPETVQPTTAPVKTAENLSTTDWRF